jgi:hypothetical protein
VKKFICVLFLFIIPATANAVELDFDWVTVRDAILDVVSPNEVQAITSGSYTIGAAADYATLNDFNAAIEAQLDGDLTALHLDEETSIASTIQFDTDTNSYLLKITAQSGAAHSGTFGADPHAAGAGARVVLAAGTSIYIWGRCR